MIPWAWAIKKIARRALTRALFILFVIVDYRSGKALMGFAVLPASSTHLQNIRQHHDEGWGGSHWPLNTNNNLERRHGLFIYLAIDRSSLHAKTWIVWNIWIFMIIKKDFLWFLLYIFWNIEIYNSLKILTFITDDRFQLRGSSKSFA